MFRSKHLVLSAVLVGTAMLGACGSAPPPIPPEPKQLPPADDQIVPGQRIGPIALGMTSKQLIDVMGHPHDTIQWGSYLTYNYYRGTTPGLTVAVDNDTQRVFRIMASRGSGFEVTGTELRTSQGEAEMRAELGKPESDENIGNSEAPMYRYCYPNGLAVTIQQDYINDIDVFMPGDWCE